jgi:hypothetical protein
MYTDNNPRYAPCPNTSLLLNTDETVSCGGHVSSDTLRQPRIYLPPNARSRSARGPALTVAANVTAEHHRKGSISFTRSEQALTACIRYIANGLLLNAGSTVVCTRCMSNAYTLQV